MELGFPFTRERHLVEASPLGNGRWLAVCANLRYLSWDLSTPVPMVIYSPFFCFGAVRGCFTFRLL